MQRHLLAVLLAPALAIIGLVVALSAAAHNASNQAERVAGATELAMLASRLDAALGAETRAATTGFAGMDAAPIFAESDRALAPLRKHGSHLREDDGHLHAAVDIVDRTLDHRDDINTGVISPLQLADRYRTARTALGRSVEREALAFGEGDIPVELRSLLSIIEAQRDQVDEHLGVDLALRYGTWAPGQHSAVIASIERQQLRLDASARGATLGLEVDPDPQLAEIRRLLVAETLPDITRDEWNEISTAWASQLQVAADAQAMFVADQAAATTSSATLAQRTTIAVGLLALVGGLGTAIFASLRLVRRIDRIKVTAEHLATDPEDTLRVDDHGRDEIGGIAQSFNSLADRFGDASRRKRIENAAMAGIVQQRPLAETIELCNALLPRGEFTMVGNSQEPGQLRYVDVDGRVVRIDDPSIERDPELLLGARLAMTAARQAQDLARLEHRANHDQLTGLLNREGVFRRLDELCATADLTEGRLAVLFLDLDGFKGINDQFGHRRGDSLLRAFAVELRSLASGRTMTPGRLGGDEFVLLVSGIDDDAGLIELGDETVAALDAVARRERVQIGVSVGAACHRPGISRDALLADADAAMYVAKSDPSRSVVVSNDRLRSDKDRSDAEERRLRRIIESGDIDVLFQPIWDVEGVTIAAFEALARPGGQWNGPSIESFFSGAERLGLAVDADRVVHRIACEQLAVWLNAGLSVPPITINLSAATLMEPDLVEELHELLASTGCTPDRLILEVTENSLVGDIDAVAERLHRLRDAGFGVAIDDFGSGYSSLSYLAELPVDVLKVASAFVADVDINPTHRLILESVLQLAAALDLQVIAEGVEREGERALLQELGVPLVQGWLLARAESPEDTTVRLRARLEGVEELLR